MEDIRQLLPELREVRAQIIETAGRVGLLKKELIEASAPLLSAEAKAGLKIRGDLENLEIELENQIRSLDIDIQDAQIYIQEFEETDRVASTGEVLP